MPTCSVRGSPHEPTLPTVAIDRQRKQGLCFGRCDLMTTTRSAPAKDNNRVLRMPAYLSSHRSGQVAWTGSRSDKVRLRRRPIRRSSRFVCEAILQAFEKTLEAHTFEICTTNHIADLAGVGIGSFYEYFSNKETVLALWLHRHSCHLLSEFDRSLDRRSGASLEDEVDTIVRGVFDCYAGKLQVWRQVVHAVYAISTGEQCARCARDFSARWHRLLEAHYPDGPVGGGLMRSTAIACHEKLLADIESAILGDGADIRGPWVRRRSVDTLLLTIQEALGTPTR